MAWKSVEMALLVLELAAAMAVPVALVAPTGPAAKAFPP